MEQPIWSYMDGEEQYGAVDLDLYGEEQYGAVDLDLV
jgi:hypothetical protein